MDPPQFSLEPEETHSTFLATMLHLVQILLAIAGAISGTILICRPVQNIWGVNCWVVSIVSVVRILAVDRREQRPEGRRIDIVPRVLLISIAVFCLIFATTIVTAIDANVRPMVQSDVILLTAFGVVGGTCITIAVPAA